MPEKKADMSTAVNWQNEIAAIAGPYTGNKKGWLSRAATKANATYRQIKGLYYGEYRNPSHALAKSILTAAEQARIQEARRDALATANLLHRHAEALANTDPDFHRESIDAFREVARVLGGGNSAGDCE